MVVIQVCFYLPFVVAYTSTTMALLRCLESKPLMLRLFPAEIENLNQWYQSGDQAYILVSACMVLIMIPGIAFLYSGLSRRKSALSLIWVVMMSFSVVIFQWYFWGYSLAFSSTATNGFIGDLHHFGLLNTLAVPSPGSALIPELLYSFYQVRFNPSGDRIASKSRVHWLVV